MSFTVRAIREEERQECLELWCLAFKKTPEAFFRRYFYGDVEWLPYYTQVGVLDGQIISAVQIVKRTVACGNCSLTMGGIANVATHPDFRGHGYNTACMEAAIKVMEADAMDFSLLFTGINEYYERVGFTSLPVSRLSGIIKSNMQSSSSRYTIRTAKDDDIPRIREIYARYNANRPITVQRSEGYWRDWIGFSPENMPEPPLIAINAAGELVGYLSYQTFETSSPSEANLGIRLMETGWDISPGEEETEIIGSLLDEAVSRIEVSCGVQLQITAALDKALITALETRLEQPKWTKGALGMARILHRDNLLRSLTMEWNDRWSEAGRPGGILAFETPYGITEIDANGSFLKVIAPAPYNVGATPPAPNNGGICPRTGRGALSQSILFGLIFGTLAPEEIDHEAQPLLCALFPKQASIYYRADGF